MSVFITFVVGVVTLACAIIFCFVKILWNNANYFKTRNIPYIGAKLGRTFRLITGCIDLVQMEDEIYQDVISFKQPIVGYSDLSGSKGFVAVDLNLIKNIMIKDLEYFLNRRPIPTQNSNKYLQKMLMVLEDDHWRKIRTKLSPAFTSAKIKNMFPILTESGAKMTSYLKNRMNYPENKLEDVDCIKLCSKFTLDIIANLAFGVGSQSFETRMEELSTFEKMAKKFGFEISFKFFLKFIVVFSAPKVADYFKISMLDWEAQAYLAEVVRDVIKRRRQTGERREDFLQLMLDAQNGLLKQNEESTKIMMGSENDKGNLLDIPEAEKIIRFDDEDVIANALNFLIAGYDNIQSLLLLTLQCLAAESEVQKKLQKEIRQILEKYEGNVTYEAVMEMKYLDMVINETMRIMPPAPRTERLCTRDYKVPGTDFVIEKGSIVLFSIRGIHRDAKYYPSPAKFIPERFTPEEKAGRHTCAFLPFGHGPRNCIGMRFALMKAKVGVVHLLNSFEIRIGSKSKATVDMATNLVMKPRGKLWLSFVSRTS